MSQKITVTGMVLSATPIGEYDKRLLILTKERGKISVFARSARKQNSVLMGVSNPFAFGKFQLYEGRTSYNLMQAEISNYFVELSADLESAYYGFYFMELADYYTRESNDESQMLRLLYRTLCALTKGKIPRKLVRYIYEIRSMVINGEFPDVFHCCNCGNGEELKWFSTKGDGVVCKDCVHAAEDAISLCPATVYTLQFIATTPIDKLYSFVVSEEVLTELEMVMGRYMARHVDKGFKSLEILEMCTS